MLNFAAALRLQPAPSAPPFMSLPPAAPRRQLKHRRSIEVQAFVRDGCPREASATFIRRDAAAAGETPP